MLPAGQPKFRRRPADRPAEILSAALEVFAERGFQAARLEEVAKRAGVSKGALYLYFETKADLFRAVVTDAISPNIEHVKGLASAPVPFEQAVRMGVGMLARKVVTDRRITGVVKLVIAESRNHPELATIWFETVVQPGVQLLSGLIAAAPTAAAALSAWARCTCGSIRKVRPPAATLWPSRTYSAATEPETGAAR